MKLLQAMVMREIQMMKSYMFNFLSGLITVVIIFSILLFGARFAMGNSTNLGNTTEALVVGFFLWSWLLGGMNTLTWGITTEAEQGTLEQLYMSPYGFKLVSLAMLGVSFLSNLLFTIPLLLIIMLISGKFLHIDVLTVGFILFFTILPAYGLGYVFGGLALLYKRIQSLFQILNMGVVAFFLLPPGVLDIIPFTGGYHLLSMSMRENLGLLQLPLSKVIILMVSSILVFLSGMWIYSLIERRVKSLGILGHY